MEDKYTISEVAERTGIEQNSLRFIEKQLGLEIPRSEGKRRCYGKQEVELLQHVQKLREEGFTLRMIKMVLPQIGALMGLKQEERRQIRQRMKKILLETQAEEAEAAFGAGMSEEAGQRTEVPADGFFEDNPENSLKEELGGEPVEKHGNSPDGRLLAAPYSDGQAVERCEVGRNVSYEVFENTMSELLQRNNQELLEVMEEKISQKIMKEMNYLFRERESLEEERYRRLDRTIREYQMARQQIAVEEERRGLFGKKKQ